MRLHLGHRRDATWDAVCARCGLCCYERSRIAGGVRIDLDRPCRYLETGTRMCKVYGKRFEVSGLCGKVTLLHALFGRTMPLTCAYVRRFRRRLWT